LAIPLVVLAFILPAGSTIREICALLALGSAFPCLVYGYVLTILHWKARYRGSHSDFWGIVLLLEVSSWSKLVYLFRHLLPDMRGSGKYAGTEMVQ
jgi:hypothetical protein